jgi:voltage-gated potassium channel Kch
MVSPKRRLKERTDSEPDLNTMVRSTLAAPSQRKLKVDPKSKTDESKTEPAKLDMASVAIGAQMMTKHKAFMKKSPLVISPRTWYMRRWDLVTLLLLLFTAVVTPVEVAFLTTALFNVLFWVNRSVDALFVCDIILNFFVAIVDPEDGQLIFHHPTVIKEYLRGWFTIDVVSVMPFDLVSLMFENESVGKLKILRVLRLLRLMKLLRILRAGRIFQRLETQYQIDYSKLELVKFAILAMITSHWMACTWGIVADLEDAEYNWMFYTPFNSYLVSGELSEGMDPRGIVSPMEIYIAAFYWSSMTMTTIGYGDILPSTWVERIFVSAAMLIGAFMYGYIIGAVGNVIAQANSKKNEFYALMGELNSFLDEGKLSPELRIRLREYFKYKMASSHVDAHTALLQQMSPALRAEITLCMNTWITRVDLFKNCPEALVIQLTLSIKQQTFPPQEKILVPGDWCDRMFIVRKGVAICRQRIVTTGQVFCVESLYKEGKVAYSAHAVTFCDFYTIDRDVLITTLRHFPEMRKHFRTLSIRRVFYDEVIAFTVAYRALETFGADAVLNDAMDERPAHFLQKLREIYGHDGSGMGPEGMRQMRMKDRAASEIQRLFRGHKARIQFNTHAAEAGTIPVFPTQVRKADAAMYSARAIDVLHHRIGTGIYSLHQKVDRLLGASPGHEPKWFTNQGTSGFMFTTVVDTAGAPTMRQRSEKKLAVRRLSGGEPDFSAPATPQTPAGGAPVVGASDPELAQLRVELKEALAAIRSLGAGSGAFGGAGGGHDAILDAAASGSLTVRTQQLQNLVGDLAQQVSTVSRTISDMRDAQRTFQERSQRTILGHLEQAQARIADQVSRAVAAAGGDTARAGGGGRPHGIVTGTSVDESDPPPVRTAARGVSSIERGGDDGFGEQRSRPVLQRRPLGGGPPARPQHGFY